MLLKYCRLTDTHYWPIYRQSSLRIPSHCWPGTYTGLGPPLWYDQYGGSHLLVISQYLNTMVQSLRHQLQFTCLCYMLSFLFFVPDPWDRARSSLYHVMVGVGTPSEGQLRITELLTLTVQSVKLLSSTGGAKTETHKTWITECVLVYCLAYYQWFNVTKNIKSCAVLN